MPSGESMRPGCSRVANLNTAYQQKDTFPMSSMPAIIADDGFSPDDIDDGDTLIGLSLKFVKGHWLAGQDEEQLDGAVLCVYSFTRQWQKWHDRKLVDWRNPVPGTLFPKTIEDLGDLSGTPGEWQLALILYLRDLDTGADYTYKTTSSGGHGAVKTLRRQIVNMRWLRPGCLPLVRLESSNYKHSEYGPVDKPKLTVIRWVTQDGKPYPDITREQPKAQRKEEIAASAERTPVNDFDDDIPF
jgi:hypothetical protein